MKLTNFCYLPFIIILCFAYSVFSCPPGNYKQGTIHNICDLCEPGYFCPGDGNRYECKSGTISSYGYIKCASCPSNRSNIDHSVCVFADTPADAIEIQHDQKFTVPANKVTNLFMTIYPSHNNNNGIVQITFVGNDAKVQIIASLTSGDPNAGNAVSQAYGKNATIEFSRNEKQYTIVYFKLISNGAIIFTPKVFYDFGQENILKDNSLYLRNVFCCDNEDRVSLIQFKKEFIPIDTLINVQFQLFQEQIQYQLLFTMNPALYQVNPNNADIQIKGNGYQITQFKIKQSRNGPFIFSLLSNWLINDSINVTLSY